MNIAHKLAKTVVRRFCAGLAFAVAIVLPASTLAATVTGVEEYSSPADGETYTYGETIQLYVSLSEAITAVAGDIGNVKANLTATFPNGRQATCSQANVGDDFMIFSYAVQAGDYADKLEWGGGSISGATITLADGNLVSLTCDGTSSPLADAGCEIKIRTFFLKNNKTQQQGSELTLSSLTVGKSLNDIRIVNAGGSLVSDVEFSVSASQDNDEFDETELDSADIKIVSGRQYTVLSAIKPQAPGGPVELYFDYYNSGRLVLKVTTIEENIPTITKIEGTSRDYNEPGKEITLTVTFSDRIKLVSGKPQLKLNIENAAGDAYAACSSSAGSTGTTLKFKYVTRAGDFVTDLDVVEFDPNGADMVVATGNIPLTDGTFDSLPTESEAGSLASTSDIGVQTIFIDSAGTTVTTLTAAMTEEQVKTIDITRGGEINSAQQIRIFFDPEYVSINGSQTSPVSLSIVKDASEAQFTIQAGAKTPDGTPTQIRIHPINYPADKSGDCYVNVNIAAGAQPRIQLSGTSNIQDETDDNSQVYPVAVRLSRAARERTTVTVTSSDLAGLPIVNVSDAPGSSVTAGGAASFVFEVGQMGAGTETDQPRILYVVPRDGKNGNVILSASASGSTYQPYQHTIYVSNSNPWFTSPAVAEDGNFTRNATAGFETTITWAGSDVMADRTALWASVEVDGTIIADHVNCSTTGSGSLRYTFPSANENGYTVTITIHDKDGGFASIVGIYVVAAPFQADIFESKAKLDGETGHNPYKSLQGLGRGSIDDDRADTTRTLDIDNSDWHILYPPGQGHITFFATPESYLYPENTTTNIDSFFYAWYDIDSTELLTTPLSSSKKRTYQIEQGGTALSVAGIFSREMYPEDGCGDIDFDGLPDAWEDLYFSALSPDGEHPFELINGDFGAQGNPDQDFLPAGSVKDEKVVYPLNNYAPNGIEFSNIYEVRGLHHGLNMRKAATEVVGTTSVVVYTVSKYEEGADPAVDEPVGVETFECDFSELPEDLVQAGMGTPVQDDVEEGFFTVRTWTEEKSENLYQAETSLPIDEPHMGKYDKDGNFVEEDKRDFYGTDPTNADSDGDGLLDGYEYYWWRVATEVLAGNIEADFQAYDPTKVVEGKPLDASIVLRAFHPLAAAPASEKGAEIDMADIDGDGLSNYEEMLLGTNPCHWDTDGDGMNDGWEVMWGLNPFDAKDANGNPDGDYMAACGASSDNILYRHSDVYKAFGFDPRTAWNWQYKERNRAYIGSDPYSYSPNTMPFTNYEECYLGRWCIDKGIIDQVEPMSKTFMTQPVPSMTASYMTHNGFTRDKVALNKTAFSGGTNFIASVSSASNGNAVASSQIDIPPEATVFQTYIQTHGCDSDSDGMPDGWELYCCCGPELEPVDHQLWPIGETSARDAALDADGEGLTNLRECQSTELNEYYMSVTSNFVARVDKTWYNKWWPTDPWNLDTDSDCVDDYTESANFGSFNLRYAEEMTLEELTEKFGGNTMLRGHVPGGGLNPNSADTDMDYIPDAWEYQYCGFYREKNEDGTYKWEGGFADQPGCLGNSVDGLVYGGGMDGTYFDSISGYDEFTGDERDFDFDHDGLENYQEYWINGMYNIQYDKWYSVYAENGGAVADYDSGSYDPRNVFAKGTFSNVKMLGVYWQSSEGGFIGIDLEAGVVPCDWSRYADDWQNEGLTAPRLDMAGNPKYPFMYMPPEPRPMQLKYASSDPRLADTDADNMDDYYEMFHGLNPILSDTFDGVNLWSDPAALGYDFTVSPWLSGMPNADPDQDDIPNWEEALSPNQPSPANHNTDPSPAWFTDISYPKSLVNLCYNMGSMMMYWAPESGTAPYTYFPDPGMMGGDVRPNYLFSFEMNEGFDTDNDNLSDKYEIAGVSGGVTDPQDTDRPVGRKALYLDGDAAARTRGLCAFGKNSLRSWTIEAWVRPEQPASGKTQVILERPCAWTDGSSTPNYSNVRRTFRLALDEKGRPYVEFNTGGKEVITEWAKAPEGDVLEANRWYHLAATMDGFAKKLTLYIDGRRVASKATSEIPYTGFTYSSDNGASSGTYSAPRWAPVVIGASDSNPSSCVDGGFLYYNGNISRLNSQPSLGDFFKGWVDEVRIWTGPRPGGDDTGDKRVAMWKWSTIKDDFDGLKRYGTDDVLASREETVKQFQRMVSNRYMAKAGDIPVSTNAPASTNNVVEARFIAAEGDTIEEFYEAASSFILLTGGEDAEIRIPPLLLCDYSFDNLPDPDREPTVPAKFSSVNGRPLDYAGQPWWRQAFDRSTVYRTYDDAPYCFPQYIENFVATQPLGSLSQTKESDTEYAEITGNASIPIFKYRPDRTVNSKFWTRDTKGGYDIEDLEEIPGSIRGVGELYENTFPNTANPYGMYYVTGNTIQNETHPTLMRQEFFDPVSSVMYNHLLPLRNARADMSVQLWDDPNGDKYGVNADTDGDGLPDWWELAYGMDPYNADQNGNGVRDDQDDFDGDGLSNRSEYLAGTNPYDATTKGDGVVDYDNSSDGGLSYGFLYTDNDYVLDAWESLWDSEYASPYLWDERKDRDRDGWDNWSEALVGTKLADNAYNVSTGSTNDAGVAESSSADKKENFPLPDVNVRLMYHGDVISGAKLVVHCYSSQDMNGWPDAVYVKDFSAERLDTWPMSFVLTADDLVFGHLRQGKNYFFAWFEKDGSSVKGKDGKVLNNGNWPSWTPGEPAGIADGHTDGVDIGWDKNSVAFHITDEANGFARFSFEQAPGSQAEKLAEFAADGKDHGVVIKNNGTVAFSKKLMWPRVWIHEGDIVAGKTGGFGLSTGIVGAKPNLYSASVDEYSAGNITNWYTAALSTPQLLQPIGREVVFSARPVFEFKLDPSATEFLVNIKKYDTTVNRDVELLNRRILVTGRDFANGAANLVSWKLPYAVGDTNLGGVKFDPGMRYTWTITAYNPAGTSTAASGEFWMASAAQQESSAAKGCVKLDVSYPQGWAFATGASYKIKVRLYGSASLNGDICGADTFKGDVNCKSTIYGLEPGADYYAMAFVDQNANGAHDNWEPWGYVRNAQAASPFMPTPVRASGVASAPEYEIVIRDADTDNDLLPDSWEYAKYGNLTSAGGDPNLVKLAMSASSAENPVVALIASLGASNDTDGDGIDNETEYALFGSTAALLTSQKLSIVGLKTTSDGKVELDWSLDGVAATKTGFAASSVPTFNFTIEATDSLTEPDWQAVKTVDAPADAGTALLDLLDQSVRGMRFFRVKLSVK